MRGEGERGRGKSVWRKRTLKASAMFDPIGTMVMFSTPAAMTTSWVPDMTACAAKWMACWDDPHWRSTEVPGTVSGILFCTVHRWSRLVAVIRVRRSEREVR